MVGLVALLVVIVRVVGEACVITAFAGWWCGRVECR